MNPFRFKKSLRPFTGAASYDITVSKFLLQIFVIEFTFPDKRPRGEFGSRVRWARIAVRRMVWADGEWKRGMALVEREAGFTNARDAQRWERTERPGVIEEMLQYID